MGNAVTLQKLGIIDRSPPPPSTVKMVKPESYEVDISTGYLTLKSTNRSNHNIFTAARKKEFVNMATIAYPNLSAVCKEIGITKATYLAHYSMDQKFREDMDQIREDKVDKVESNTFEFSGRPANFMDRMAILRAYRGDLYNPKQTIVHEQPVTPVVAKFKTEMLTNVQDAEMIGVSAEVLEAEIVEQPALQVPGALSSNPEQSPSGPENGVVVTAANTQTPAHSSRDPLLDLLEE